MSYVHERRLLTDPADRHHANQKAWRRSRSTRSHSRCRTTWPRRGKKV